MDRSLLEAISDAYQNTIDPTVHLDKLADIISHSDSVDYKLSEMELIEFFDGISEHDQFFDSLNFFARHMYTKYNTYTKTHLNRYFDDLPDEFIKNEYSYLVDDINTAMKTWMYVSDSDMMRDIKHHCDDKFPALKSTLASTYNDFIRSLFISEKMNRLYHMTKNVFIPKLQGM
jgi:hypothetical protein